MIKKALEYLKEQFLSAEKVEIVDIEQGCFTTSDLNRVRERQVDVLHVSTLESFVEYLNSNVDKFEDKILVHVEGPKTVSALSKIRSDGSREVYIEASADVPEMNYGKFYSNDKFNIMLQSIFTDENEGSVDRNKLLAISRNVVEESVKELSDNGVSQQATVKQGVRKFDVEVPNPALLAPYRTFTEVNQPASKFVFRMDGTNCALFEADGGAWRKEAVDNIKVYLKDNLDPDKFSVIS